jgi:glycerol kinase
LLATAAAVEELANSSDPEQPVLFVPGLVGLGAPHWVPEARGVLFGLTRNTTAADLGRATLEGVAFQVADLVEAAAQDAPAPASALRVDGGMSRNAWFLQCQADLLGLPVQAAADSEASARGAAFLAGLHLGIWANEDTLRGLTLPAREFTPLLGEEERRKRRARWQRAVQAVIGFYQGRDDPIAHGRG